MSRKSKHKKHDKKKVAKGRSFEDRRGDAVTVAWMLCAIATGVALVLGAIAYVLASRDAPSNATQTRLATALFPLMLFTSAVTGIVLLCLTPLVYLVRRVPPPMMITIFAVLIGLAPFLAMAALAMTNR